MEPRKHAGSRKMEASQLFGHRLRPDIGMDPVEPPVEPPRGEALSGHWKCCERHGISSAWRTATGARDSWFLSGSCWGSSSWASWSNYGICPDSLLDSLICSVVLCTTETSTWWYDAGLLPNERLAFNFWRTQLVLFWLSRKWEGLWLCLIISHLAHDLKQTGID